jgi:hypothetical protein
MTNAHLTSIDVAAASEDAFVFAYPLVLMELMRIAMTSVPEPDENTMRAPVNRLVHTRRRHGANPRATPQADTLISSAWLDLADGPIVLSVPETHGRYYVISIIDLWTNVFASIGPRTTGTGAGAYAIGLGGAHAGRLPAGVIGIDAPTPHVLIAGQTCMGRGEDDAVEHGYGLAPLGRPATARAATAMPAHDAGGSPPAELIDRLDAEAFFGMARRLLADNPPRAEDRHVIDRARQAGLLTPCGDAWMGDAEWQRAVEQGARRGRASVRARASSVMGGPRGQWHTEYANGDFGTDYLSRAGAACAPLRTVIPADALAALSRTDDEGRPLTGRDRYELRFAPDETPPVYGSWVLSTHAATDGHSFSLGDRDGLTMDGDGSLPIYIHHGRPARSLRSNWLPAPAGDFTLLLRSYWPHEAALTGRWTPPAVRRVG